MQIIINIDENVFTRLFDDIDRHEIDDELDDLFTAATAVRNGTILPKGHGNLKDVSQLAITPIDITDLPEKGCLMVYLAEDIDEAPTIIEADKEEK